MTNISPDRIKNQLQRILASSEFMSGKRLGQFLRYVVEQSLIGQSGSIKQYAIALEALGYRADFNPQTNPTVRILARRLRRALDQYYFVQGNEDPIRIDIPKGSYTPIFSENHTASEAPVSPECPSPVPAQTSPEFSNPTIAVIMFDCLNAKAAFDYVATGLTEEIIIALTRFSDFQVVGPLSRNIIHRKALDTSGIGQQYGVRFVLEGTLRGQGEMLRLTVRLADAMMGQQLWGQVLDFNLQNDSMMAFENDLVSQVVAAIADSYGVIPRVLTKESLTRRPDNSTSYEAVLYFYHYIRVLTPESHVNAMKALEKAVQRNPEYATAAAMLGDLLASTYLVGYEEDESILTRAEVLGRKAMAIDPNCQAARYTMALIYFLKFKRTLFLEEVEQTLKLNSNNANAIGGLSMHMAMVGKYERAMKLMGKAMRLNPHHPGWYHIVAFVNHYRQGEYDLALIEARRFNSPDFFWDPLIRAAVLGQLDRQAEARKAVDELLALVPDFKRRGQSLIRRFAYLDEHTDMLLEGLRKAGLEL